jgi:isoprenylcysteine carboxyl methyltransferase (ICMT) family protein YpbQ
MWTLVAMRELWSRDGLRKYNPVSSIILICAHVFQYLSAPADAITEKTGGSWSCEDMTIVLLHAKVSRF